jgi:hypothetical protein
LHGGSVQAVDPGEAPLAISAASSHPMAIFRKMSRSRSVLAFSARTIHSPTYSPYSFAEDMTHPATNPDDSQNTQIGLSVPQMVLMLEKVEYRLK